MGKQAHKAGQRGTQAGSWEAEIRRENSLSTLPFEELSAGNLCTSFFTPTTYGLHDGPVNSALSLPSPIPHPS
jgi:hypothetical protein